MAKKKIHLVLMLIKWGALVVDGRGKLGGHVGSANKGGSYLRTKVTPVNPRSVSQTGVRALFGSISQAWSGLSPEVIASWNNAVDEWKRTNIFGDLKIPSGKALYQRLNQQAQIAGHPAIAVPPAKLAMVSGTVSGVAVSISGTTITAAGLYNGAAAIVMMYSSGPVSAGTTFVKNKMRLVYKDGGSTFTATDSYTKYAAKFGTPTANDRVFFGYKYVLPSGQASPMQIIPAAIT